MSILFFTSEIYLAKYMPMNKPPLKDNFQRARQVELLYKLRGFIKLISIMGSIVLLTG
jgi:hypothetical protein